MIRIPLNACDIDTATPHWRRLCARVCAGLAAGTLAVALGACGSPAVTSPDAELTDTQPPQSTEASGPDDTQEVEPQEASGEVPAESAPQETCDWEAPKLTGAGEAPEGQNGDLSEVIVGSWQHTHTDEGSGFEEVTNDHRYVFTSPDRMLYCQHVPGATDYAENGADIVLTETVIELPGGAYSYTITAWDEDRIVWDNPVGGGYVYLLQRR